MQKTSKLTIKTLTMGAICIALSFVLSYIRLFRMPQGGSITLLSMLPVMLFAYLYGMGPGLLAGLAYSFLQMIQGVDYYGFVQFLLDYPIAFTLLGTAGILHGTQLDERVGLPLSVALGGLLRILSHFLSGWLFFGSYAPAGQSPVLYSLGYQLSTIGPDALLCIIAAMVMATTGLLKPIRKMV